jgi:hypothetical protein
VAKVTWNVNGNETQAATLNSVLNRIGPYKISLTVESAPGPTGEITRSTSQPIVFEVVAPRLMAQPEVTVNGKPLAEAGPIHPGAMLTLTSANTTNAKTFDWKVGDETLSGQTVNWQVPTAGTYEIIHTVIGDSNRDTAPPISITAVDPELAAVAEVLYQGKPFSQSSNIYVGEKLLLDSSKSSGPVKGAAWTVNGEKIDGKQVEWPISEPGQIEIRLRVEGDNPGLVNESDVVKVFAKKRPPVWALWALGLAELGMLAFFAWLLTGNQVRDFRLTANGSRKMVKKFFSRFSKTATIPFNKLFQKDTFWEKAPDSDALIISRSTLKGPPADLGCTFAPAYGGTSDVCFEIDPEKPATKTQRFYFLQDDRDPDNPRRVEFTLQSGKTSYADLMILAIIAVSLVASFFWFYLKIYPAL